MHVRILRRNRRASSIGGHRHHIPWAPWNCRNGRYRSGHRILAFKPSLRTFEHTLCIWWCALMETSFYFLNKPFLWGKMGVNTVPRASHVTIPVWSENGRVPDAKAVETEFGPLSRGRRGHISHFQINDGEAILAWWRHLSVERGLILEDPDSPENQESD